MVVTCYVLQVLTTMTRRDPRTLTSLPDILSCLSSFQAEETELSSALGQLLSSRAPIVSSLDRLHALCPELDALREESGLLSRKVSSTALTAERVGGRVQSLDEEMRRAREAGEHVGQVIDLKVRNRSFLGFSRHLLMSKTAGSISYTICHGKPRLGERGYPLLESNVTP